MLLISFNLGQYRYAMRCESIIEIAPLVSARPLTGVPDYVAGVIDYRGELVPIIDLCRLCLSRDSEKTFGTRILIVRIKIDGWDKTLGLIAENVTNTIDYQADEFEDVGVELKEAPYMGKMFRWENSLVQIIECDNIINEQLRQKLFVRELETN